jgi:hypothetical protein
MRVGVMRDGATFSFCPPTVCKKQDLTSFLPRYMSLEPFVPDSVYAEAPPDAHCKARNTSTWTLRSDIVGCQVAMSLVGQRSSSPPSVPVWRISLGNTQPETRVRGEGNMPETDNSGLMTSTHNPLGSSRRSENLPCHS